ncbi:MAG TPA: ABC transporter permease, partial [Candidatus Binatia bacterium]|nr:ABC transporter permease [Candidatus Binatia bacterium]
TSLHLKSAGRLLMISSYLYTKTKEWIMSKMRDVINFEVRRNLKRKSFWIASLMPVVLVLGIIGISVASSNSASKTAQKQAATFITTHKLAVLDETGLINERQLAKDHITIEPTKQAGIAAVQNDKVGAFFYYPKNISGSGIEIYAQDQGLSFSSSYSTAATGLLQQEVIARVNLLAKNSQLTQIIQNGPKVTTTTYKNGKQTNGLAGIIAPGIFMIAFLVLLVLMSYIMITSTTEEKENRTAEILLTAIKSRTLIFGKILSIFVLGLMQLLVIIVPLLIAYALFRSHITLPGGVTLSHIPLDATAITFGVLFFIGGLLLFTGFLVGLSALFPSAQEAGRYLGPAFISAFIPIYTLSYIVSSPHAPIVRVFTYFPLTAPTMALLQNAAGTLSVTQAFVSLAVIAVSAALAMMFAIRAFRYGAMEYGRRVSVKELL